MFQDGPPAMRFKAKGFFRPIRFMDNWWVWQQLAMGFLGCRFITMFIEAG